MSIAVTCACGHPFPVAMAKAGLRVECPACGRETVVTRRGLRSMLMGPFLFLCIAALLAALLLPNFRSARGPARRMQCASNLKNIGLALHGYDRAKGCLPPAAITSKDGKPLLSWRVLILPYLGNSELHAKFHLDEPWDSPHNRTLIESMPLVFSCPSDPNPGKGMTVYQVVVGPKTPFPPDFKHVTSADITDGPAQTLFVGESRHPVPWTKPEDLSFDSTEPHHGLAGDGGPHPGGFNAVFGDGGVRFLNGSIPPGLLDKLLTGNGGEVIPTDEF